MRSFTSITAALLMSLLAAACSKTPTPDSRGGAPGAGPEGSGGGSAPGPSTSGEPSLPEPSSPLPAPTRAPELRSQTRFAVAVVAGDLRQPWALAFTPEGRMLVTQKHEGSLVIVSADGDRSPAVDGVPRVVGQGQAGLLDVEVAPDYAASHRLYLSYVEPREGGNGLAVARARLVEGAQPKLEQLEVIFRASPTLDSDKHAGGRLVWGPSGHLFITLGERSIAEGRAQAQDLNSHLGKVVRVLPDGTVPQDNPFVDRQDARPEIWSLGHRNPLAAAFDAQQRLWVVEMGPRGGDELNLIEKGNDYGWPTIGYGTEYSGAAIHATTHAPGMEQPVYYWDPVISPGAMAIYSGALFPEWQGNVFIAGLSGRGLVRLVLDGDRVIGEERLLTERAERLREVTQGPDGALYLLTDGSSGQLLKITPAQ